ncbi:MAG: DUF2384 domain-containing protein [Nitrospirae bacterium]|nr:DUF2384 domain-containing protein [Nitrospirota bacterium]
MYNVTNALGGKKKIGNVISDYNEIILKGIPVEAGNFFKELLRLTDKEFAKALGISERSFHRKKGKQGRLPVSASDRLYRFARIFSFAVEVMGSEENARQWLSTPHFSLERKTPLEMLKTDAGAKEVDDILGRIKYGMPV